MRLRYVVMKRNSANNPTLASGGRRPGPCRATNLIQVLRRPSKRSHAIVVSAGDANNTDDVVPESTKQFPVRGIAKFQTQPDRPVRARLDRLWNQRETDTLWIRCSRRNRPRAYLNQNGEHTVWLPDGHLDVAAGFRRDSERVPARFLAILLQAANAKCRRRPSVGHPELLFPVDVVHGVRDRCTCRRPWKTGTEAHDRVCRTRCLQAVDRADTAAEEPAPDGVGRGSCG